MVSQRKIRAETLSARHHDFVKALRRPKRRFVDSASCTSPSSKLTVVDFVKAAGGSIRRLKNRSMQKYTDRRLLALSAQWAQIVSDEVSLEVDSMETEKFRASLNPECARLEIDGLSFLASISVSPEDREASIGRNQDDDPRCEYYEDDDNLGREIENLTTFARTFEEVLDNESATEELQEQDTTEEDSLMFEDFDEADIYVALRSSFRRVASMTRVGGEQHYSMSNTSSHLRRERSFVVGRRPQLLQ